MKLEPRRTEALLRDPAGVRAVLLYGDDVGLIRERASRLVRAVVGAADDPFRITEIERDGVGGIPAEMAALSMTGGRRVVRLREAGDAAAAAVQAALAGPGAALLVLEAPGLPTRSKLRALIERAADAVAVGCYPVEGRALEQSIRAVLASLQVEAEDDALAWLAGQLGADQAVTARELEKLALFVGAGGRVDVQAARACVGDLAGLSLEDALYRRHLRRCGGGGPRAGTGAGGGRGTGAGGALRAVAHPAPATGAGWRWPTALRRRRPCGGCVRRYTFAA